MSRARRVRSLLTAALLGLLGSACFDVESGTTEATTTSTTLGEGPAVLLAVGDIADCDATEDEAVARLVDTLPGAVLALGDIAYPHGSPEQFEECFGPAWGRHRDRIRPAPGNHEYGTTGAAGYFDYFGSAAGERGKGWHSFDIGDWHLVALNSNCAAVGGCGAGSEQERWLRADLAAATDARCTLAYWHHARFSSGGTHGSDPITGDLWRALADAGADVVLVGHEHNYERFAPLDPAGRVDPERGIRQFVVGTGGRSHYGFGVPHPGSEVRESSTFGLLEMTLSAGGYRWRFVPVADRSFTDAGEGGCH